MATKSNNNPEANLKIQWHLDGDGMRPVETAFGYAVRNPLVASIPPGATRRIDLHVATDHPMHVWPTRAHAPHSRVVSVVPGILQPGEDLMIDIENKSQHVTLTVETKEVLVNLSPVVLPAGIATEVA
jgi:hypothetical protein